MQPCIEHNQNLTFFFIFFFVNPTLTFFCVSWRGADFVVALVVGFGLCVLVPAVVGGCTYFYVCSGRYERDHVRARQREAARRRAALRQQNVILLGNVTYMPGFEPEGNGPRVIALGGGGGVSGGEDSGGAAASASGGGRAGGDGGGDRSGSDSGGDGDLVDARGGDAEGSDGSAGESAAGDPR